MTARSGYPPRAMTTVRRVSAIARLDDPRETLARAQADAESGDESWGRWVAEYGQGEAIVVWLEVEVELAGIEAEVLTTANHGVFVETALHPPKVEQQIAEIATKDFESLARKLNDRGHEIECHDLAQMYVHVELADDVRCALADRAAQRRADQPGGPRADARLADHDSVQTRRLTSHDDA